jgi:hypothetical protein
MPVRRRSKPTLRERGMKPPHSHSPSQPLSRRNEVECGWCEHEKWERFRRTQKLHDMTFNRYIIREVPF